MSQPTTNSLYTTIAALSFYPVLVFGLIGAIQVLRQPSAGRALVLLPIVAITIPHAILTACTRFRWPVDTWWIVLAAVALVTAADWFSAKVIPSSVGSGYENRREKPH